jgi:hypothetical protein
VAASIVKSDYRRLFERRLRAAEHRLSCYDFGSKVISTGVWTQHGRDSGHWRRPVALGSDTAQIDVVFAITFDDHTNHMIEAYAAIPGDTPLLIGKWSDDVLQHRSLCG